MYVAPNSVPPEPGGGSQVNKNVGKATSLGGSTNTSANECHSNVLAAFVLTVD